MARCVLPRRLLPPLDTDEEEGAGCLRVDLRAGGGGGSAAGGGAAAAAGAAPVFPCFKLAAFA